MKKPATAIAMTGLVGGGSVADPVKFDDQIVGRHEIGFAAVRVVHDGPAIVHGVGARRADNADVKRLVVGGQKIEGGAHGGDGLGGGLCAHTTDTNRVALTCQHVRQRKSA